MSVGELRNQREAIVIERVGALGRSRMRARIEVDTLKGRRFLACRRMPPPFWQKNCHYG
jgi:hypothetical protein